MGKKKKASNKLAKMSDEEKARYLQHRADVEEEARRRKQELIATFLKNKLKKEEAYTRINLAKINQEWRQILRKWKCRELNQELDALRRWMDYIIGRKNEIIANLVTELDEGEEQYNRSLQTHLMSIDRIINIYKDRLSDLNSWFETQKDKLINTANAERQNVTVQHEHEVLHLKSIIFKTDEKSLNYLEDKEKLYLEHQDEIKSTLRFEYDLLKNNADTQMGILWKDIASVLNNYLTNTEDKRKDYDSLKEADKADSSIMIKQSLLASHNVKLITKLRRQLEEVQEKKNKEIEILKSKAQVAQLDYNDLKDSANNLSKLDNSQLTYLTITSGATIEKLNNILTKGEGILSLVSMCNKYLSEEEKIEPWAGYVNDEKLNFLGTEQLNKMEKFWWRYNNAVVDHKNLKSEKQKLEKENEMLKIKVKSYMAEMVLNGETRLINKVPHTFVPKLDVNIVKRKLILPYVK